MPLPYHAGKSRLAKPITKILLDLYEENPNMKNYAEPFCGMLRVGLELMKQDSEKDRIEKFEFSDINKNVVALFKGFKRGWLPKPKPITQEQWDNYKNSKRVSAQKSFYGFALGFSGQFMTGSKPNQKHNTEKYMKTRRELFKKILPLFNRPKTSIDLKNVNELDFKNTIIYCDPPYFNSAWRSRAGGWNKSKENEFWETVYGWLEPDKNNIVLVSNGEIPEQPNKLSVETLFKKSMVSPGNWRVSGKEKKRNEYLFKITRT